LASAAIASDTLVVVAYGAFNVSNTYTQAQADARYPLNSIDFSAGKNKVINGDFGVWQRGTSSTVTGASFGYGTDRWPCYVTAGSTVVLSQQAFTAGAAPVAGYESNFFLRFNRTVNGGSESYLYQRIENVKTFAAQTVTYSFWAKASSAITFPTGDIYLEQNFGTGGSAAVITSASGTSQTISTSWARYTFTLTVPSVSGKTIGTDSNLGVVFRFGSSFGTFSFDIWGVQLEAGSVATAFQTASGSVGGELALCQRYYHRFNGGGSSDSLINSGLGFSTTVAMFIFNLGTTMRTAPSSMEVSNQGVYNVVTATAYSGGTWALNQSFDNSVRVIYTHGSPVLSLGSAVISSSTSASNYFAFSAEL
jgi:hypothetical protein